MRYFGFLLPAAFRTSLKTKSPPVSHKLTIPVEFENSVDFTTRTFQLFKDEGTRVYIDTSFLMWMTKVGAGSRGQLINWLEGQCGDRITVPVWAAHEYLRHHIAGTILDELQVKTDEMTKVAKSSYRYLRPYLDLPLGSAAETPEGQQANARNLLNELQKLVANARKWEKHYAKNAEEVIAFINRHSPENTPIFEMLVGISGVGADRFDGRVPPGFQDRNKKEKPTAKPADHESEQDSNVLGSNRWGDLVFWKEILAHSAETRAADVIILTNDQKNDWQLGGRLSLADAEMLKLKKSWKPLPFAHPMLSLEAKLVANVDTVSLLDTAYLGVLLHRHDPAKTSAFVDVAIVPDPLDDSEPETLKAAQKKIVRAYAAAQAAAASANSATQIDEEARTLFLDDPKLRPGSPAFSRALLQSKAPITASSTAHIFMEKLRGLISVGGNISSLWTQENLAGLDNTMVVAVARDLHDEGVNAQLGHPEALTDLIGLLDKLPPLTASCVYLGFLASMYLRRTDNVPREQPSSPVDHLIFSAQTEPYAAVGIDALNHKFKHINPKPLYLPSKSPSQIEVSVKHQPIADGELFLDSMRIAGEEVLSRAQSKPGMNLVSIFEGDHEKPVGEVVKLACKRFAVPFGQIATTDDMSTIYRFPPELGLKEPREVGRLESDTNETSQET